MTSNRNCNLECLQDKAGADVLEFVGPVKIVLVDTPQQRYYVNVGKASALLLAAIMLGITTMSALFFSTTLKQEDIYKALHILVCTIGMQIFMPFAILSVKRLSGPAAAMKLFHRRLEHIILHFLGYICIAGGIFVTFFSGYQPYFTPHSCLGLATGGIVLLNAILGLFFSLFKCGVAVENLSGIRKGFYYVHKATGSIALVASAACFITGIMKQPYVDWLPIGDIPFQLHVGLCVTGYQLLMFHGILSLANYYSWSSSLTYDHRGRCHWVLQLLGSALAATGSIIMMRQKLVNFTSVHGKLALAALIFTGISLLNGFLSLYRIGLPRFVTARTNKVSHFALGTVAFTLSSVCLVFGILKRSFREWSSVVFSYLIIVITCVSTVIIISRRMIYCRTKIVSTCEI